MTIEHKIPMEGKKLNAVSAYLETEVLNSDKFGRRLEYEHFLICTYVFWVGIILWHI